MPKITTFTEKISGGGVGRFGRGGGRYVSVFRRGESFDLLRQEKDYSAYSYRGDHNVKVRALALYSLNCGWRYIKIFFDLILDV